MLLLFLTRNLHSEPSLVPHSTSSTHGSHLSLAVSPAQMNTTGNLTIHSCLDV